jgi:hypothetical protein
MQLEKGLLFQKVVYGFLTEVHIFLFVTSRPINAERHDVYLQASGLGLQKDPYMDDEDLGLEPEQVNLTRWSRCLCSAVHRRAGRPSFNFS